MKLRLNGEEREIPEVDNLADLLRTLQIDPAQPGLAVAMNGAVVPRRELSATPVEDGDRIEVVRAVQGG